MRSHHSRRGALARIGLSRLLAVSLAVPLVLGSASALPAAAAVRAGDPGGAGRSGSGTSVGEHVVVGAAPNRMRDVRTQLEELGASVVATLPWGAFVVEPPAGSEGSALAAKGRNLAGVRYAEATAKVTAAAGVSSPPITGAAVVRAAATPNDPLIGDQWHHTKIGSFNAWDYATGSGVRVAVIDSGITYTNPDLLAGAKYVGGHDYVNSDEDPADDNGHGTWVSSLAGATRDNSQYGAGVAPGAEIIALKVLNAVGEGDTGTTAIAISDAVDTWHAKVINLSLVSVDPSASQAMGDACAYAYSKGALVVAAVGNAVSGGVGPTQITYPAAYDHVVAVGGTTETDEVWSGSVHATLPDGRPVVTLAAPSVNLYGLWRAPLSWTHLNGTSGATGLVSGAAAAVWSRSPGLNADQVVATLAATAFDVPPAGPDAYTGYGRIQLDAAMQYTPRDAFEPDDAPAQALASARAKATDSGAYDHTSVPAGDVDYQHADLVGGRTYRFWTSDLSGGADTYLRLYGTDQTTVLAACDDVAGEPWSEIVWTCPATGLYLIANADTKSKSGSYRLNMRDLTGSLNVKRLGGADRYDAAAAIAAEGFPGWAGVTDVVVVCGEDRAMADPLSAAGLCSVYRAPLLLTRSRGLNNQTRSAIASAPGRVRVHIVGGPASVTPTVETALRRIGNVSSVDRITGLDRYELAANVARRIRSVRLSRGEPGPTVALVANGQNMGTFFDALALSSVSASKGYPLLLVKSTATPPATLKVKRELGIREVYVGGSPTNVGNNVYSAMGGTARWWGVTAWDTALAIAENAAARGFVTGDRLGVAAKLPDALTGAATFGQKGGVMMPTPTPYLSPQASSFLAPRRAAMWAAYVYGGPASVNEGVLEQMRAVLR